MPSRNPVPIFSGRLTANNYPDDVLIMKDAQSGWNDQPDSMELGPAPAGNKMRDFRGAGPGEVIDE